MMSSVTSVVDLTINEATHDREGNITIAVRRVIRLLYVVVERSHGIRHLKLLKEFLPIEHLDMEDNRSPEPKDMYIYSHSKILIFLT